MIWYMIWSWGRSIISLDFDLIMIWVSLYLAVSQSHINIKPYQMLDQIELPCLFFSIMLIIINPDQLPHGLHHRSKQESESQYLQVILSLLWLSAVCLISLDLELVWNWHWLQETSIHVMSQCVNLRIMLIQKFTILL